MSFSINKDAEVTRDAGNGSVTISNGPSGHTVVLSQETAAALLTESEDTPAPEPTPNEPTPSEPAPVTDTETIDKPSSGN